MPTAPIAWFRAALTEREARWSQLAARVAFAAFLISLLTGLLLPIYTDEIGWRVQLRAGIDGGVDRMLSDICGPNTVVAPPLFMMPFRYASGWLNLAFPDPLYVRLLSTSLAVGWAFLLRALIGRIVTDTTDRARLTALAFALLGMGVLPIMLVMGRPDQVILLSMTGALMVTAIARRSTGWSPHVAWLWPWLIVALALTAISWHLKGILMTPLFLTCVGFAGTSRQSLLPRVLALLVLLGFAAQGANYWVGRFRCPDDPVMAGMLNKENIAAALEAGGDWRVLVPEAIRRAHPATYLALAESRPKMMSDWLPRGRIGRPGMIWRFTIMRSAWNLAIGTGGLCLIFALGQCWRRRRADFSVAAPLVLAGLVLVWGVSQRVKNDYEIMIVLPMMALFCVYALSTVGWPGLRGRLLGLAAMVAVAASLAGQVDIARRYLPLLARGAQRPGYVAGQDASMSPYGYSRIRSQIIATAHLCGIGLHGRAQHPVIDDVTYFALEDSWQPMHYLAVLRQWRGRITDPLAYMRSRGSEGMVLGCHHIWPSLLGQATRNGAFCCIGTGATAGSDRT